MSIPPTYRGSQCSLSSTYSRVHLGTAQVHTNVPTVSRPPQNPSQLPFRPVWILRVSPLLLLFGSFWCPPYCLCISPLAQTRLAKLSGVHARVLCTFVINSLQLAELKCDQYSLSCIACMPSATQMAAATLRSEMTAATENGQEVLLLQSTAMSANVVFINIITRLSKLT